MGCTHELWGSWLLSLQDYPWFLGNCGNWGECLKPGEKLITPVFRKSRKVAQVAGQPQPFINNLSDEADRNLRKFGDDTELGTVTDTSEGSAAVDQLGRVEKWMNGISEPCNWWGIPGSRTGWRSDGKQFCRKGAVSSGSFWTAGSTFSLSDLVLTVLVLPREAVKYPPWRSSEAIWTQSWAVCSACPCLSRGFRPDGLQKSLPVSISLWFCGITSMIMVGFYSQSLEICCLKWMLTAELSCPWCIKGYWCTKETLISGTLCFLLSLHVWKQFLNWPSVQYWVLRRKQLWGWRLHQLMKAKADHADCCVLSLSGKSEENYLLMRMELYIIGSCLSGNLLRLFNLFSFLSRPSIMVLNWLL